MMGRGPRTADYQSYDDKTQELVVRSNRKGLNRTEQVEIKADMGD